MNASSYLPYSSMSQQTRDGSFVIVKEEREPIVEEVLILDAGDFSGTFGEYPTEKSDTSHVKLYESKIPIREPKWLVSDVNCDNEEKGMVEHVTLKGQNFKIPVERTRDSCVEEETKKIIEMFEEKPKITIKSEPEVCDGNNLFYHDESDETTEEDRSLQYVKEEQIKTELRVVDEKIHVKDEDTNKKLKYNCHMCHKTFMWKSQLERHFRVHTGERPFTCKICDKAFKHKDACEKHMLLHSDNLQHECSVCNKRFTGEASVLRHKLSHAKRPFTCKVCNEQITEDAVKTHMWQVHQLKTEEPYVAEGRFACRGCPKSFMYKSDFERHRKIHTGERPFVCRFCDKRFLRKAHCALHESTHFNESPLFKCPLCNQRFKQKAHMTRHVKRRSCKPVEQSQDPSRSDGQFECPVCNKHLTSKFSLKQHGRIHTNEQPFACNLCDKRFKQKVNLKRHIHLVHKAIHTKPQCQVWLDESSFEVRSDESQTSSQ